MKIANDVVNKILFQSGWTPEKLRDMRERLGLSQSDIANIIGVSKSTVSHVELGYNLAGPTFFAYCIVLERYYAWVNGYLPSYRKIGMNEFMEIKL